MNISESEVALAPCFKLKGSRVTITILELYDYNYHEFTQQLAKTVKNAPDFFNQAPVIISLEKYTGDSFIDFIEIGELCREYGLIPVAVRGGSEEQSISANVAGMPQLAAHKERSAAANVEKKPPVSKDIIEAASDTPPENILISQPVRSGQQILAPNGDLIIVAAVGAGAEVLASGNIHVYGPLRGRALAGINGNHEARIFCHSLEAELISIGGSYKVSEDLRKSHWKQTVQARLDKKQLIIESIF